MYSKYRTLMYKKCEKTFEILRSEITLLMDLYIEDLLNMLHELRKSDKMRGFLSI